MFSIRVDKPRELIEVRLAGMLKLDEVAAYIAEVRHKIAFAHLRSYAMVIDVTDCPIQPQEIIKAFGQHMAAMPKARSLAIVCGGSLSRLQVRRLFTQPYARVVATADEGRAWVLHGTEPVAA